MIILWALLIGVAIGAILGGRLDRLAALRIAWAPLAVAGLLAQVVLFSGPASAAVGDFGPVLYVGSTAAVLLVVVRNGRLPGLAIVAVGALANLAAIMANGGFMPTTAGALAAAGLSEADGYSNSLVVADPALAPLTDVFALPPGVPFANVFSVGDVLVAVGLAVLLVVTMRTPAPAGSGGG